MKNTLFYFEFVGNRWINGELPNKTQIIPAVCEDAARQILQDIFPMSLRSDWKFVKTYYPDCNETRWADGLCHCAAQMTPHKHEPAYLLRC